MTTILRTVGGALVLAAVAAGCPAPTSQPVANQADSVDREACTHLANGPAVAVTAAATPGSAAPLLAQAHARYDVALSFIDGANIGYVRYQSGKAGDYVIYLNHDVPVAIQSAEGPAVAIETSAKSSPSCGEIKGRHVVPLGIGTYYIKIGPAAGQRVGMLVEPAGEGH